MNEEEEAAMLKAWETYHGPLSEWDEGEYPPPPPAFIRGWEDGIEWVCKQWGPQE